MPEPELFIQIPKCSRKRKNKNLCFKVLIPFILVAPLIVVVAVIVTSLHNPTTPRPHSGSSTGSPTTTVPGTTLPTRTTLPSRTTATSHTTVTLGGWSSWGACDLCLASQKRSCILPHESNRSCRGRTERTCTPSKLCADDDGNSCCDRNGHCTAWNSSAHGNFSQCCVSNTTFNDLVWPSNTSGLTRDGDCCLGSLSSWNSEVVSAIDKDGVCCRDKQNVSGVSKNGECFIGDEGFSAIIARKWKNNPQNGASCFDSQGASAVARISDDIGCNHPGDCCSPISLSREGLCCLTNDGA